MALGICAWERQSIHSGEPSPMSQMRGQRSPVQRQHQAANTRFRVPSKINLEERDGQAAPKGREEGAAGWGLGAAAGYKSKCFLCSA